MEQERAFQFESRLEGAEELSNKTPHHSESESRLLWLLSCMIGECKSFKREVQ